MRSLLSRRPWVGLCLVLIACSAGNTKDTNRDLGGRERDARQHEEDGASSEADAATSDEQDTGPDAEPAPEDAAETDAVLQPDAGGLGDGGSEMDAAMMSDATSDPGADGAVEAGQDAALDAAENDAGARNVIYATFGTTLVRIDPDTAQLTEVGTLRNAAEPGQTFSDVVMSWSGSGDRALMVTSYYVAPGLASVDLCTGLVQLEVSLLRPNSPRLVVEGLAQHPNGTWYVTSGNPDSPATSPISSNLGTLVRETGMIMDLGTAVTGLQGDGDMLFFRGELLYGVDVVTNNSRLGLFTFDLSTGKDTQVVAPSYGGTSQVPLRVAYDASRDKAFSWRPSDRNLLVFDLVTGAATPVGQTHPAGSYGNAPTRGFFVAPAPNCAGALE